MMDIECLGITGGVACGKSYFTNMLIDVCKQHFIEVHHIDFDKLAHEIYEKNLYGVNNKIKEQWDDVVKIERDNTWIHHFVVDRKKLGEIVFNDEAEMTKLNDIMKEPIKSLFVKKFNEIESGLVLLDCALIAEHKMFDICDEKQFTKCIVIDVPKEVQSERLRDCGMSEDMINSVLKTQYSGTKKRDTLYANGFQVHYENVYHNREPEIQKLVVTNILRNFVFEEGDLL